jgi:hypothetical protein
MNAFEKRLLKTKPLKTGQFQGSEVRHMPSSVMGEFFGYAFQDKIFVRNELSKRVQRFVISHERYHLVDRQKWLGWFGAELRANIYCGLQDPIGLMATITAKPRIRRFVFYAQLVGRLGRKDLRWRI